MTYRITSFVYLLVGIALTATSGCRRDTPAAAQAGAVPGGVRVVLGKPMRKTLTLSTQQPGRIEAFEEAPLYAQVVGYVKKVHVDIGDKVEAGQTLVTIDVPELRDDLAQKTALVAQAAAEEKQATAAIQAAKSAQTSAAAKVTQAQAGIGRTESEVHRWTAEFKRIQELAANGSLTGKLVEETQNHLKAADATKLEASAAVDAAQAFAEESRVKVLSAEADAVAAAARLRVAQANENRSQTMLNYAEIKTPFAGVITRRLIATGHYVNPPNSTSASPLLTVCRTDVVRIFVDVPELEAEFVSIGDKAEIRVQALGGKVVPGSVTRTAWALDASNRSLRTEIDIDNPDGVLRPGMFATAAILLEQRPDVVVLLATAIVRDGADAFCCVVVDGKIERRKLELGLRSGTEVEVRSGLSAEQYVVTSPVAALKPGQPVEVATAVK
jgi:HlyD family secretion protein